MFASIVGGLFRTVAAILSGYLIAKGVDAESAVAIVGAVGGVAVGVASAWDKKTR